MPMTNLDVSRARSSSQTLLPDTELCNADVEYARIASEPFLFHHVMRSASLADSIGRKSGVKFDHEVLAASPWLDMHESLLTALVGLFHKNPKAASSNPVAEACERRVSGFKRFNLCDRLVDTHAQRNGRIPR